MQLQLRHSTVEQWACFMLFLAAHLLAGLFLSVLLCLLSELICINTEPESFVREILFRLRTQRASKLWIVYKERLNLIAPEFLILMVIINKSASIN
jgi:hypothetical protein